RAVTLVCGAQLVVDFAPPPPGFGTVTGVVRDHAGTPMAGMFVGSSWGTSTTTASDGSYTVTGAPSNPDGSARAWSVTAVPRAVDTVNLAATVNVSVGADQTVTADITLGKRDAEPPANRPPVATITPSSPSTPEGTAVTLSAASSSDPDGNPLTYAWDLDGDGFDDGTGATISVTPPHPLTQQVRVQVTDSHAASAIAAVTLAATNVAPTVSAGGDETIAANGAFDRPGRMFSDPGDRTSFTVTASWGDGTPNTDPPRLARTFNLAHTFAAPGTFTVVVTVCDPDGGCGQGSFKVTVPPVNAPPVARVTAPVSVAEGGLITFDASTSSDPEAGVLTFAWDTDADGDFDDSTAATVEVPAGGPGTRAAVVKVTDPKGAAAAASATVTVLNAAPSIDQPPDQNTTAGAAISPLVVVRDVTRAPGGYTATVDWGDGGGPRPAAFVPAPLTGTAGTRVSPALLLRAETTPAVGTVELLNAYATPGTYTVTLTVCDAACTTVTFAVIVTDDGTATTTDLVTTITWPGPKAPGTTSTATVFVRNDRTTPARPVVVLALPPTNAALTSLAGTGWTCDTAALRCTADTDLEAGQVAGIYVTFSLPPLVTGTLDLVAVATSTVADTAPANNVARATLTVAVPPPPVRVPPTLPPTGAEEHRTLWLGGILLAVGLVLTTLARGSGCYEKRRQPSSKSTAGSSSFSRQ
ncbi:MAG TPA: PKD domain-containing protein, partial [Acidimicrobiales bacterium]